jgi:hypothetical protein
MDQGEVIEFPRGGKYKPLTIRSTVSMIRENTGQSYSVSVKNPEKIVVTRIN